MRVQLVDQATRTHIGQAFKLNYRLMEGDEVYYTRRDDRFDDTVWTVVRCRSESYDHNKQVVFVIPKSQKAIRILRGKET